MAFLEMDGLNHLRIDEVYDADSNGEMEDPSASGDAWRVQRVYVNGPGQLGQVAKVIVYNYVSATSNAVASEDVYYYHYDILGNVSVISDPSGDEADQFEQDAFGNLVSGSWTTRIGGITEQITTKQYDADLGLYYFNARWYDPQAGAFVSRDPVDSPPGSTLTTNKYTFSENVPTGAIDPTGLKACIYLAKKKAFTKPGSWFHGINFSYHPAYVEEFTDKAGEWNWISTELHTEGWPPFWVGFNDRLPSARGKSNTGRWKPKPYHEWVYDITPYCEEGCLRRGGDDIAFKAWRPCPVRS